MMLSIASLCLASLLRLASILLLLSVSVSSADTEWRQVAILTDLNSTLFSYDGFGMNLAIDDGIVVVGAHLHDMAAENAGAVFIYGLVDGEWSQEAMIIASDAQRNAFFGYSVAVSNGFVSVGAILNDNAGGTNAGAVYVYVKEGDGSWTEQAKLVGSDVDEQDRFGWAISMHESTLIASAPYHDDRGTVSGSVYVFTHEDGSWTEQTKLTPSDGSFLDTFGSSVAVHGAWMVIGSSGDDEDAGSAYVFRQMADGSWTEQAKLTARDGEAEDWFGWAVDVFGGIVTVGAPYNDDGIGAAYLFNMVSGTWTEQSKLVAEARAFGNSLCIEEEGLFIGAPSDVFGSVSFFAWDGATWTEQAHFAANDTQIYNRFGHGVAVDQGTMVIGSHGYRPGKGAVYIYQASPSTPEPSSFPTLPSTNVPTYEPTVTPSSMIEPSAFPTTKANPNCERVVIDFEEYAAGDRPFNLGYGVRVRGDGNRARHGVMAFDTANPTGENEDLASDTLGKILILTEDGDTSDPDDNMLGGYIRFSFEPPVSEVISVDVKDFDTQGSSITGKYADGSVLTTISIDPSEAGGEQTVRIGESNLGRLKINLAGSGGIDNLTLIYCEA